MATKRAKKSRQQSTIRWPARFWRRVQWLLKHTHATNVTAVVHQAVWAQAESLGYTEDP